MSNKPAPQSSSKPMVDAPPIAPPSEQAAAPSGLEQTGLAEAEEDPDLAAVRREVPPLTPEQRRHLRSHLGEEALVASVFRSGAGVVYQPLSIVLQNVRANSKVFVTIRDDQHAVWSEGNGRGLVGLSFSATRDPALYVRNFLINAREFFVQTFNTSQEIRVQLYVRTAQADLRGRVDLPPGATVTLQTRADRTSLVGLSAFAIDF